MNSPSTANPANPASAPRMKIGRTSRGHVQRLWPQPRRGSDRDRLGDRDDRQRRPGPAARGRPRTGAAAGSRAYCASSPASNGPHPSPSMFAPVATSVPRPGRSGGAKSTSVAVAVPVKIPADRPERTRPISSGAEPLRQQEHDRAERRQRDPRRQHGAPPDLVGQPADQQQRGDHAGGVGGEDHRDRQLGEPEPHAVERVQRRRQRRAEHRHRKRVRGRRERGATPESPSQGCAHLAMHTRCGPDQSGAVNTMRRCSGPRAPSCTAR